MFQICSYYMYCFVVVSFQITLATRDKATIAPAVNYPIYLKRPGSASVTLTTPSARLLSATRYLSSRSKSTSNLVCQQRQHHILRQSEIRRRPISADCSSKCERIVIPSDVKNRVCIQFKQQLCCNNTQRIKVKIIQWRQKTISDSKYFIRFICTYTFYVK